MELWDKQKGESPKAFVSFAAYRDLGPLLRTHNKVHEITGAHIRTIEGWSSKYKWQERVDAYDAHNDKKRQIENLEKVNAMNDEQFSLGKALLVKAAKALTRIPDDEIKASDIARMVKPPTLPEWSKSDQSCSGSAWAQRMKWSKNATAARP